jgi:hypothetical protein
MEYLSMDSRGIKGVSKGDERAVGDTIGATVDIILDEDTTIPVLTAGDLGGSSDADNHFKVSGSPLYLAATLRPANAFVALLEQSR